MAVPGLGCCAGFSLVVAHMLLIAAAFLVGEHRRQGTWAQQSRRAGARARGPSIRGSLALGHVGPAVAARWL